MEDEFDSPRDEVLELLSNAVAGAVAKLQLAADGAPVFCSDRQLRACVALARMASLLLANREEIEQRPSIISPLVPPEEAAELLRRLRERTQRYWEEQSSSSHHGVIHHEVVHDASLRPERMKIGPFSRRPAILAAIYEAAREGHEKELDS